MILKKNVKILKKNINFMLDNLVELMYNLVKLVRAETKMEDDRMPKYFKSVYTGQVYKVDFIPVGIGWEEVSEAEYLDWCKKMGIKP